MDAMETLETLALKARQERASPCDITDRVMSRIARHAPRRNLRPVCWLMIGTSLAAFGIAMFYLVIDVRGTKPASCARHRNSPLSAPSRDNTAPEALSETIPSYVEYIYANQ